MAAPILTLDFARTRRFDRRLVFARPSPARRGTVSGPLRPVPSGQPRLDPDHLLLEPAATNLLLNSNRADQAGWYTYNCTRAAGAAAPDGSATACKLVEDTATAVHRIQQRNIVGSGTHTGSVHVKAAERGMARLRLVNPSGGVFTAVADLTAGTLTPDSSPEAAITAVGGGWYRLSVTGTLTGTSNQFLVMPMVPEAPSGSYLGDGSSGILIWGAQLEAGTEASSFIATTDAAGTRAAESCRLPLAALPGWSPSAGTLLVEAVVPQLPVGPQTLAALDGGSGALRLRLSGSALAAESAAGGTPSATPSAGTVATGVRFRAALAWNAEGIAAALDGAAPAVCEGAPPAGFDALHLGSGPSGAEQAAVRLARLTLYPDRLPDAVLRRLTQA